MQGDNKTLCTFLCLHSLTVVVGSWVFEVLRNPLEFTAFPSSVAIFLVPPLVPLSRGYTAFLFPLQTSCAWHSPEFCLGCHAQWLSRLLLIRGLFASPVWDFSTLWTPDPVAKLHWTACISHKTQAFVVLLFQSPSQTASLVHRHTPSPKNGE